MQILVQGVNSAKGNVQGAKCKWLVQSAPKSKVQSAKVKVQKAHFRVQTAKCKLSMQSAKCNCCILNFHSLHWSLITCTLHFALWPLPYLHSSIYSLHFELYSLRTDHLSLALYTLSFATCTLLFALCTNFTLHYFHFALMGVWTHDWKIVYLLGFEPMTI